MNFEPNAGQGIIGAQRGISVPRALLVDLGGTPIDSDAAHMSAFNQILLPYAVQLTSDTFDEIVSGNNNEAIFAQLVPELASENFTALASRKEELVLSMLDRVSPSAGARALLLGASEAVCKIVVFTNAPCANAIPSHLSLVSFVTAIVAVEDAGAPKPSAAPYAVAMNMLGVNAEDAVATEDSVCGVTSAYKATPTLAEVGVAYGFI
jgi:beta-phosphoglucomutase-like phosphatase (HAD superfamily)